MLFCEILLDFTSVCFHFVQYDDDDLRQHLM